MALVRSHTRLNLRRVAARRTSVLICLLAAATLAAGCNFGGGGSGGVANPPPAKRMVPRLQLGRLIISGVLNTYGQPRLKTPDSLWYVGPEAASLAADRDGWMTLLTFDDLGYLRTQEFMARSTEQNYLRVDYWISDLLINPAVAGSSGKKRKSAKRPSRAARMARPVFAKPIANPFEGRDRDEDFDQLVLARCVVLAQADPNYRVTAMESNLFVLSRVLPGENEPLVTCQIGPHDDRAEVTMVVKALPGRDDGLIQQVDAMIRNRVEWIQSPSDEEKE